MKCQDCCQKGCVKMWLLTTQLLITVIYMVYFCLLIFSYDNTVAELREHFPSETSIKLGIGIIFAVSVYLVINTFCGCCVAWQAQRCFYLTFIVCTLICMAFILGTSLYSIIKYKYYPIGVVIYEVLAILSIIFAHKIRYSEEDPEYQKLLEEIIDRQAEELYSYSGARTQEEQDEINERVNNYQQPHRNTLEKSIKKQEAGFFDFRRDTVLITKLNSEGS